MPHKDIFELGRKLRDAAWANDLALVKKLARRGAMLDLNEDKNRPALMVAIFRENSGMVKFLLEKGADPNIALIGFNDFETPLTCAAGNNAEGIVKLLLAAGADMNGVNSKGQTALMVAVERNDQKIVRMFVEVGANAEIKGNDGLSALHLATPNADILQCLFDGGAGVDVRDEWGGTPLHHAAHEGNVKSMEFLVAAGARIDLADDEDDTALDIFPGLKKIIEAQNAKEHLDFIRVHRERMRKLAPKPGPRL